MLNPGMRPLEPGCKLVVMAMSRHELEVALRRSYSPHASPEDGSQEAEQQRLDKVGHAAACWPHLPVRCTACMTFRRLVCEGTEGPQLLPRAGVTGLPGCNALQSACTVRATHSKAGAWPGLPVQTWRDGKTLWRIDEDGNPCQLDIPAGYRTESDSLDIDDVACIPTFSDSMATHAPPVSASADEDTLDVEGGSLLHGRDATPAPTQSTQLSDCP